MSDDSPLHEFIFGKDGDAPRIELTVHGIPYAAVTVERPDDRRKMAVLADESTLAIEAPAAGDVVRISVELVDDHA